MFKLVIQLIFLLSPPLWCILMEVFSIIFSLTRRSRGASWNCCRWLAAGLERLTGSHGWLILVYQSNSDSCRLDFIVYIVVVYPQIKHHTHRFSINWTWRGFYCFLGNCQTRVQTISRSTLQGRLQNVAIHILGYLRPLWCSQYPSSCSIWFWS